MLIRLDGALMVDGLTTWNILYQEGRMDLLTPSEKKFINL